MQKFRWQLLLLLLAWLTASGAALPQGTQNIATVYVEGGKGAVIAFLPAMLRDSHDQGAIEARALVGLAIESAKRCLGDGSTSFQVVFADRIVIRWPGGEESFEVGQFAPLTGGLLFRPGSSARILFAGGGPSALVQMLSATASEYFGRRCISG